MAIRIGIPSEVGVESVKVVAFFKEEWTRPIALGDEKFYRWQFVDVPYQNDVDSCCVAVEDGKVVGVMGVNERIFYLSDTPRAGAELTTWIVKESHRNRGIGPKIINYLTEKYEVLIGMGITDEALTVYLRNGFRYLKAIPRFVKVLDWDQVGKYASYTPLAKKVAKSWSKNKIFSSYEINTLENSALEKICLSMHKVSNMYARESKYVQWRYKDHPYFTYDIKLVKRIEAKGDGVVVVLREETSKEGLRILHVVDCFGDLHDMEAALSYIEGYALEKGVSAIDFFCTNSAINSFFLSAGWFSILDDSYFQLPHLFQPLELRNPATTSLIYWAKDDKVSLCDLGKLYITKEDCDFDRPILN